MRVTQWEVGGLRELRKMYLVKISLNAQRNCHMAMVC